MDMTATRENPLHKRIGRSFLAGALALTLASSGIAPMTAYGEGGDDPVPTEGNGEAGQTPGTDTGGTGGGTDAGGAGGGTDTGGTGNGDAGGGTGGAGATHVPAQGSVTVEAIEGNTSNTYKVYQVFTADVSQNDEATHVAWNEDAKSSVLAFLDDNGYPAWLAEKGYSGQDAHDNAQNAAEFISAQISSSAVDGGAATDPATRQAASFANRLARALARSGVAADTATVGTAYTNTEGYYLIVTDPASVGSDEAATAPIWLALGGSVPTITEKSAMPTVRKKVKGVGDAEYSLATDAFTGQDIDYRLTGTMPSNIGAFTTYHYRFTDTMSGIDLQGSDTSSVTVTVGGQNVTDQLTGNVGSITYQSGVLSIDIANVLALNGVTVDKNTEVVVDYKAHNTSQADGRAGDGGTNAVALTYTADPVSDKDVTTSETSEKTKTYSYKINATKIDKSNKQVLPGAKFSVQLSTYSPDSTLVGKYVQADGSLGDGVYEFESSQDGTFDIPGLDAGTYTIAETAAPSGYEVQDANILVEVAATIDGSAGELEELDARISGGEAADNTGDEATRIQAIDKRTGTISMLAVDDRTFVLAKTGLEGLAAHAAIAMALAGTGITGAVAATRRGKSKRGNE